MTVGRTATIVLRASAALPAAGAYVTSTAVVIPAGVRRVSLRFAYARGAVGGYPFVRLHIDDDNPPTSTFGIANGSATQTNELVAMGSGTWQWAPFGTGGIAGAGVVVITYPIVLTTATRIAVEAAEGGAVGTPGTLGVSMVGDVES